ncbi:MAG: chain length determinant protein EpsF [Gammaproteobacteria bacterium]
MNFTQFLLILNARKWIILGVLLVTVSVTATVSLLLPKEYAATTTLVVDSKSKDPITGQMLPSQMFPGYMATQVDILKSSQVAGRVVRDLNLAANPATHQQFMEATQGEGTIEQWLSDRLLQKLSVEPSRESSIISVGFEGSDPRFAAIVANAFARAYIETSLDLRVAPAKLTANWFDQQIVQLREKVDQAQQRLTAYQRENGIVESEERLDVETRRMADLAAQMVAAQSASYDAHARMRDSRSLPEVINNPVVQSLKSQVAQGEGKLAELAKRVGASHPDLIRLQAEVNTYKLKLANELSAASRGVDATAGAARQRFNELSGAFGRQKGKVLELKQQREEATLLARDLENAQRIYDSALQRYGQSRMEAQSTQTDIAVLSPAIAPTRPSGPRVQFNLLLAVFFGTLLGVSLGFLIELLDRRVRSGHDILGGLEIPVLAEVSTSTSLLEALRRLFYRNRTAMA